jgi:hypothetical protein
MHETIAGFRRSRSCLDKCVCLPKQHRIADIPGHWKTSRARAQGLASIFSTVDLKSGTCTARRMRAPYAHEIERNITSANG